MLTARFRHLRLFDGARVLDLGCGEGRHVHGLAMAGDYTVIGVDLDTASLAKAKAGLESLPAPSTPRGGTITFEHGDATALPFADDSFDAVICSEVLEHLPDYSAALAEIRRVLRPEGMLCVSVPNAWPERICWRLAPPPGGYAFEPGGHIRIFDRAELRIAVERHGFAKVKEHRAHGLHVPYWWLKCAFWNRRDNHPLIRAYHRMLVWDLMKKPLVTQVLDAIMTPVMGKSIVLYFSAAKAT